MGRDTEKIVQYIERNVDSVSAVLVVVDGTSLRLHDHIHFMASTLFTIIPKALVKHTAFVVTAIRDPVIRHPVLWGFSKRMIPGVLKDAPLFTLDIPTALQKRLKDDPNERRIVEPDDQRTLGMLVKLFDWLNDLEQQPATEIACLHETYQNIDVISMNILEARDQEVDTRAEIDRLSVALKKHSAVSFSLCFHPAFESYARWM